jgi:hypothetical protein
MAAAQSVLEKRWTLLLEIVLIVAWAIVAGRQYLDFDPATWLYGSDYPLQILDYYVWDTLKECGACVFWNGFVSGGWPAFGDYFGGHLHPLVVLSALLLGAIQGSKVIVVAAMMMAGIAQWWLARVMGLGVTARLWAAGLAVIGGHLSGRMDMGLVIMMFSIASTSLVLAPLVEFGVSGRQRPAIWLGVCVGLALLSGQGYMQLGMVFALAPAALILFWGEPLRRMQTRLTGLLAGGLAVLVSAVNLLPLARFWGNIDKAGDPYFAGAQPVAFIPLNMLIADYGFYTTEALQKKPFPAFYMNFIGWIPVALALLTIFWVPRKARRVWFFFIGAILLVYLASSGSLFRILVADLPFLSGARHPALISPLSVPLVLGLAAWGLDLLIQRLKLPQFSRYMLRQGYPNTVAMLLLGGVLLFGLSSVYQFSQRWQPVAIPVMRREAAEAITTILEAEGKASEWIQYPPGDLQLATVLVDAGFKVNIDTGHRNAGWRGRSLPPAYLAVEKGVLAQDTPGLAAVVGIDYSLLIQPENQYAQVVSVQGNTPCTPTVLGGKIDVICSAPTNGTLVVHENMLEGWRAWRDGEPVTLASEQWLTVEAPAGAHTYQFRYQPWDAIAGLILSCLGSVLAVGLALRPDSAGFAHSAAVFGPEPAGAPTPPAAAEAESLAEDHGVVEGEAGEPPSPPEVSQAPQVVIQEYPRPGAFVHVDIELDLPDGAEAVIDITCQPDGQLDIRQE